MSANVSTDPLADLDPDAECAHCGGPALGGDEPGRVPMAYHPADLWWPICSQACTEAWFDAEDEDGDQG